MGQVITLEKYGEFTVTGILEEFSGKTHFNFKVLASTALLPLLEKQNKISPTLDDWNNYYTGYVYFKLREGVNEQEVETALSKIVKEHYANLKLETRDKGYEFYLHILNETALSSFGFVDAHSALGQSIMVGDTLNLQVIGVVKDFHFRPLNYVIGPVAFRYQPDGINILSVRVATSDVKALAASMETIWKKHDPVHPMEWQTMEGEIDQAYSDAGFNDVLAIVGYISFIAVSLACLGMLGMAMYGTRTRVKEIGIRKVMGAGVLDILLLLSRSFLILIGIAVVIGVPLSYLLGDLFLSNYAYRITITPGLMILGVTILMLLGILTICTQTMAAALANPVSSLRYEW